MSLGELDPHCVIGKIWSLHAGGDFCMFCTPGMDRKNSRVKPEAHLSLGKSYFTRVLIVLKFCYFIG